MLKSMRILHLILIVSLVLIAFPATVFGQGGPNMPPGFQGLRGEEARNFQTPPNMAVKAVENLSKHGVTAIRLQQMYGDVPVFGGQLTIYRNAAAEQVAVVGAYYPEISARNSVQLHPLEARKMVAMDLGQEGEWLVDLLIDPQTGHYFYQVENRRFDSRWFYWIDAESGLVINAYDGLADGEGKGVLGDMKDLTGLTTQQGGTYLLESADGRKITYDARNRNRLPGNVATDDNDTWDTPGNASPGHPALVDAHFYANVTDDYYRSTHSFNWLSYFPQGMVSSAHVGRNYNNAYWNGSQMAYGDGDGVNFIEFSGDLDVVGHELSHGVTDATSNLIYQNESGALNEAFSDIMGTAIEYYYGTGNWTIGEDITVGSNGIRNMMDPTEDGDPSHYADRYTGTGDNGGVHINSGIANHWFYLLVEGGQNAKASRASGTNVQGIGLTAAEQIAYLGFTALATNANFCAARAGTIAVAGGHSNNVADAWDEVGVTDSLCNGGSSGGGGGGALNVTVSTNKATYTVRETVTITVHVEDDKGANVSNAVVDVRIETPGMFTYSGSTSSNSNGDAIFTFKPGKRDGTGVYHVTGSASKSGYTPGSASTSFTVQ